MDNRPEIIVTNFNRNFTGVSATAAAVLRCQVESLRVALAGQPLPGCPTPISRRAATALSRHPPKGRPFVIWHVRRNPEMRAALFARDILRLPVRIVFTSAAQRRHSALPRWLISRMDAVIATTKPAAAEVPHVRAIIPHGVDVDTFHPARDRSAAWAALHLPGTRGIATVGRIRPEKGTDLFVDAMIAALPRLPGTTALIIGRATLEHRQFEAVLKAKVAQAGLSERILFIGECAPADLPRWMRAFSLLVTLPRYEGYGMTPLEAMASAVPFIASDAGHFRDFADNGAGIVIPQNASAEAAQATINLLTAHQHLADMSATARARAQSKFSVMGEAAGIAQVYEELWQGARKGQP